jgi:hypothetical protein
MCIATHNTQMFMHLFHFFYTGMTLFFVYMLKFFVFEFENLNMNSYYYQCCNDAYYQKDKSTFSEENSEKSADDPCDNLIDDKDRNDGYNKLSDSESQSQNSCDASEQTDENTDESKQNDENNSDGASENTDESEQNDENNSDGASENTDESKQNDENNSDGASENTDESKQNDENNSDGASENTDESKQNDENNYEQSSKCNQNLIAAAQKDPIIIEKLSESNIEFARSSNNDTNLNHELNNKNGELNSFLSTWFFGK